MLLRASSAKIGTEIDLRAAVEDVDSGLEHGALLAAFAEAATRGSEELDALRGALLEAVGPAALVEAAATVGAFNGLVRIADGTGIPLDDGTLGATIEFREVLGLNAYAGARSTDLAAAKPPESDEVSRLFR